MQNDESKAGLIYSAIPAIMADIEAVAKDRHNREQNYKFRGIEDLYNGLQKIMAKHGVFTVPSITGRTRNEIVSKSGSKGHHVITNFTFRFYAKDGSFVDAQADGECLEYGDKSSNKVASVAHKYALLQVFCVPTQDMQDPDSIQQNSLDDKPPPIRGSLKELEDEPTGTDMDLGNYKIGFGKYLGKRLADMTDREISGYISWLQEQSKSSGKPITGNVAEFIRAAQAYLNALG